MTEFLKTYDWSYYYCNIKIHNINIDVKAYPEFIIIE